MAALLTIALKATAYAMTGSVGTAVRRARVGHQPRRGDDGLCRAALFGPAGGHLAHLRPREDRVLLQRPRGGPDPRRGAGRRPGSPSAGCSRPQPLEPLGLGLALSLAAAVVNGGVGILLVRVGKRHGSIVLEADGKHLLTDVWTSAGVLAGLGLVALTGWEILDPLVALVMAANILWTGVGLMRRSFDGLMDAALPAAEQERLRGPSSRTWRRTWPSTPCARGRRGRDGSPTSTSSCPAR